jgi:hypothetical protein
MIVFSALHPAGLPFSQDSEAHRKRDHATVHVWFITRKCFLRREQKVLGSIDRVFKSVFRPNFPESDFPANQGNAPNCPDAPVAVNSSSATAPI